MAKSFAPVFVRALIAACDYWNNHQSSIVAALTAASLSPADLAAVTAVMASINALCAALKALFA